MKTVYSVIFLVLVIESNFAYAEAKNTDINTIEQKIDLCMLNNQYNSGYMKNCLTIADQALAETGRQSQLLWEYAGMIRRNLGNAYSLKYYDLALNESVTPERCIDDGLDLAVKSGLDFPVEQFPREVRIAQEIVFHHCWAEFKEEIIGLTEDRSSTIWRDNVCSGAQGINQKALFSNCP